MSEFKFGSEFNRNSAETINGPHRTSSRAMYRAVGLKDEDFQKPFVGVANLHAEVTPCNSNLDVITNEVKKGVRAAGGTPIEFRTITISDAISINTEGMKGSLISREVIADSIELVCFTERFDALIGVGACDKNLPGILMAAARLDLPSVVVYGGSILPGVYQGKEVSILDLAEGAAKYINSEITATELREFECAACPGSGACGGMFTANTMAAAVEAMGIGIPNSASIPNVDSRKLENSEQAGRFIVPLIKRGITARKIITKKSIENAITTALALGGSTNLVLHILAIAQEADIDLTLDEIDTISKRVPHIANLAPSGEFMMAHLDKIGGIPVVLKILLDAGLIHGDTLTVTGKTLAENLQNVQANLENQKVLFSVDQPINAGGSMVILKGNLAPDGAVMKITSKGKSVYHQGPARVFETEKDALESIESNQINKGDVVVIRNEGPKGGPGMREMTTVTIALVTRFEDEVALLTDGRFSGATRGPMIGHVSPEAAEGGPIALINEGDIVTIDSDKRLLHVDIKDEELRLRKEKWTPRQPRYTKGVLGKYARTVSSAAKGAITSKGD